MLWATIRRYPKRSYPNSKVIDSKSDWTEKLIMANLTGGIKIGVSSYTKNSITIAGIWAMHWMIDEGETLRKKVYKVNPRDNFQGKQGWLTGVCIPHEAGNIDAVVDLAVMALEG